MERSSASSPSVRATRRTEGVRVQGRSARVVEEVLDAAAEELGRVGFAALRVEDVAALSGVNKTTIYRRWPTKADLVMASLLRVTDDPCVPDTGSLRDDLLLLVRQFVARVETPRGRGVVRTIQAERGHADFAEVVRRIRAEHSSARRELFDRAVARGELPNGSDTALLVELVMAPIISRVVHLNLEADEEFLQMTVDVVIAGARAGAAVPRPKR